jgi:TRAP-type C4-dicarboxylate transport system permease small subunit
MSEIDGETIYVQGMSDPTKIGQYPATQATVALIVSILGLTFCCLLPPVGLMLANSAIEITKNHPGHPDQGLAKAAQVCSWLGIAILIMSILFTILYIVFIGVIIAAENGA